MTPGRLSFFLYRTLKFIQSKIQCCGSGMFIPDPEFYPSRIRQKQQKMLSYLILRPQISQTIEKYFIFEQVQKKVWGSWLRIKVLFTQKIGFKLSEIWVRDPGSEIGIRKKPIPDPGSATYGYLIVSVVYPECLLVKTRLVHLNPHLSGISFFPVIFGLFFVCA